MRSIRDMLPKSASGTRKPKRPAQAFVATKAQWQEQVAQDSALSVTALRIALVLPKWLNASSLLAWPSQATVAQCVGCSGRAVRAALARLEKRGHLVCVSKYRGGRQTNRYRIVLGGNVIEEEISPANENRSPHISDDGSSRFGDDQPSLMRRNDHSAHPGTTVPPTAEHACQGTQEETHESIGNAGKASAPTQTVATPERQNCLEDVERGPRVTKEQTLSIMAEVLGPGSVNEWGGVRRGE